MNGVRVGIIGIGNMGSTHFKCIKNGEITGMTAYAVCDICEEKLTCVSRKYPEVKTYKDYKLLISDPDVDAVIIAVPYQLHGVMAEQALKNGKHVLVEKPIDISVSAAKRLCDTAKNSGKVFGIMFNQRTNGLFKKAREIVKSGELGELKRSVWIITNWYRTQYYYDSGTWRATWKGEGGGVLLNQAPHNLDIWQWICGMPSCITAFCNVGKYHNIEVEDEATIYAEYENGATGVFITSTGDCPGTNRLEITGTRGKMVLEQGLLKLWRLREDERDICKTCKNGFLSPEMDYEEFTAEKETGHPGILQNFTNAVLYGEELLAPGFDGINELTISNAAYLSQWKGNKRIAIPFDCDEFDKLLFEKRELSSVREIKKTDLKKDSSCLGRWQVNW